ncbi:type III polyketide synthase [Bacillus salacetis]|uniref:Type III polyketide synthase n=1 Tax=Bacillus salacetis TaxID=2315464 RepID=A0A3A1QXC7_9BACI|nr:3-oxoacyl-[acyl-carrier-protein] synthase III C-terminal domain-containing protein [Bacillus salacetis]RIW33089.1 type III polyketide synthase [Bacillus salacetis]
MPKIVNVETAIPPYCVKQAEAAIFAENLFSESFRDIKRLMPVFQNGDIEARHFVHDLEWFKRTRSFQEKNDSFISNAVELGTEAVRKCIENSPSVDYENIDAIITVCSTGLATPSLEARIMNNLPFPEQVKRIPIWGLGCAGGASGLSRAYEYCLAFPKANVLVLTVELCSLTFQHGDRSKSNLIGTSLFADGTACTLVCGDDSPVLKVVNRPLPAIFGTQSTTMKNSLDVMGWDVKDDGLFVVFSKDIPAIVESWLKPNVEKLLMHYDLSLGDIKHFIAHPGGKKVLDAYGSSLGLDPKLLDSSREILRRFGNMSSATIQYVLKDHLTKAAQPGEIGLGVALGPGFSSELLLMRWE